MAAIASKKGREQSLTREYPAKYWLANNSEEVLPEGCKYAKCVQKDGDQKWRAVYYCNFTSVLGVRAC